MTSHISVTSQICMMSLTDWCDVTNSYDVTDQCDATNSYDVTDQCDITNLYDVTEKCDVTNFTIFLFYNQDHTSDKLTWVEIQAQWLKYHK